MTQIQENTQQSHRFQINLKGMIELLSDHLYSSPDVFLRELLQNSVDAISMRDNECEAPFEPEIQVYVEEGERVTLFDSGVGLTEDEVHRFLATIGQSIKRVRAQEMGVAQGGGDYLGQFGIGLLACFMVSDEIEVYTRSARTPDAPTLHWLGRADGTYDISVVEDEMTPGTRVELKAKSGKTRHFTTEYIEDRLTHFGRFLKTPISLVSGEVSRPLNREPLWRRQDVSYDVWREESLELGQEVFGERFSDVIYLESEAAGLSGVAFVTDRPAKSSVKRRDHVYLKGMLLSDKVDQLLPSWAFFTRAIINTERLHPVASREAFVAGERLDQAKREVAECIRAYLRDLATTRSDEFKDFLNTHYYALKHLCAEDDEFLRLIGPWLPLETSSGRMSLRECVERSHGGLCYASTVDQFRELSALAEAQKITLINAGYSYDLMIIQAYARLHQLQVVPLNSEALVSQMSSLNGLDRELVEPVLEIARETLAPFGCRVSFKSFEPASVPALYGLDTLARRMRQIESVAEMSDELFQGLLNDLTSSEELRDASRPHFVINYKNSIAQTLPMVNDPEKLRRLIEVLYVQTLLLGHHAMSEREMSLISESLTGLMMLSVELH